MAKMFIVRVKGTVGESPLSTPVAEQIADMLRYDQGTLISSTETPVEGKGYSRFEAVVHSVTYSKARWDSFLLKTEMIGRL